MYKYVTFTLSILNTQNSIWKMNMFLAIFMYLHLQ